MDTHELAINWTDNKAFTKNAAGNIVSVTLGGGGGGSGLSWSSVPATPTTTAAAGSIAHDSLYFYVSSQTDTWVRAALSTWVPLGAPTGLSATAGIGQVLLAWTAPSSNGGYVITDYVVQFSSDSGSTWTTFSDGTSTSTSATVTGLTNGTAYTFRVAAVNSIGTGPYTAASNSVTPSSTKIAISRTNGTSTFTGAGTSASPYVRATEVLASNADALQYYRFTASASCTVSYAITGIDAGLNGEFMSVRKNGTQVASLDYNGYDGAGIARSGSISLASGDVLSFIQAYTASAFKNVSVSAV